MYTDGTRFTITDNVGTWKVVKYDFDIEQHSLVIDPNNQYQIVLQFDFVFTKQVDIDTDELGTRRLYSTFMKTLYPEYAKKLEEQYLALGKRLQSEFGDLDKLGSDLKEYAHAKGLL